MVYGHTFLNQRTTKSSIFFILSLVLLHAYNPQNELIMSNIHINQATIREPLWPIERDRYTKTRPNRVTKSRLRPYNLSPDMSKYLLEKCGAKNPTSVLPRCG